MIPKIYLATLLLASPLAACSANGFIGQNNGTSSGNDNAQATQQGSLKKPASQPKNVAGSFLTECYPTDTSGDEVGCNLYDSKTNTPFANSYSAVLVISDSEKIPEYATSPNYQKIFKLSDSQKQTIFGLQNQGQFAHMQVKGLSSEAGAVDVPMYLQSQPKEQSVAKTFSTKIDVISSSTYKGSINFHLSPISFTVCGPSYDNATITLQPPSGIASNDIATNDFEVVVKQLASKEVVLGKKSGAAVAYAIDNLNLTTTIYITPKNYDGEYKIGFAVPSANCTDASKEANLMILSNFDSFLIK